MRTEKHDDINCGRHGFTLLEVMVASFLMVMGFLALSGLVIGMMRGANLSRHTVRATGIAQSKIEEIRSGGYETADSGSETVESYYSLTWTSAVSSVSTIKNVSVAASWTDHTGKEHDVELKTMLTEERSGIGNMSFTNMPVFAP